MWIRSQDKELLIKASGIEIDPSSNGTNINAVAGDECNYLGTYQNKERCLEILNLIQSIIREGAKYVVFEMPEE